MTDQVIMPTLFATHAFATCQLHTIFCPISFHAAFTLIDVLICHISTLIHVLIFLISTLIHAFICSPRVDLGNAILVGQSNISNLQSVLNVPRSTSFAQSGLASWNCLLKNWF